MHALLPSTCGFDRIAGIADSPGLEIPLADAVSAGFPSPAQDYQDGTIDLNRELVAHPRSTFCVRVRGQSMRDANLHDGDVLIVDRSLESTEGCIAVCLLDGEFLVKYVHRRGGRVLLVPANPLFKPLEVAPESVFEVWGVVTYIVHKAQRRPSHVRAG